MAQLKDSLITGDLRVTGTIYGDVPLNDLVDADDLKAIEALSGTSGLLKKTAANIWTLDTTAYKTGTVTSVRVQATSPVVSSVNTAQTSTLNTTISLADGYGDTKNPYASKTARYVLAAPASAAGEPTFRQLTNADVGLGNVENTKLSTWTGSTAITTLGTITTGTVPWANISGKPSQATAWPNWNQIQQSGAENLSEGASDVTDNTEIFTSYASNNGFADTNAKGVVYRRDAIHLYNYIKGKTDALYAPKSHAHGNLTNDGKVGTIADKAVYTGTGGAITAGTLPVAAGGTGVTTIEDARKTWKVIAEKDYTGVIASANTDAGGIFHFLKIRPTTFNTQWTVKGKVWATTSANIAYTQNTEFMITGDTNTYRAYANFNTKNTTGSLYYYIVPYCLKEAGYNAGYSHCLGINLRYATNNTNTNWKRDFHIEIWEADGCTVEFFNTMTAHGSVPGYGTTNYNTYWNLDGISVGLQETADANDVNYYNREQYGVKKAKNAIQRYMLMLSVDDEYLMGVTEVDNTVATTKAMSEEKFDPFREIFYWASTTRYAAGANIGDGMYRQYLCDIRYALNVGGNSADSLLTARKPLFLVASPTDDNMAVLHTTPFTQSLPTTEDGLLYIYLGMVYPDTKPYRVYLTLKHPVYKYINGKVREIKPAAEIANEVNWDNAGTIPVSAGGTGSSDTLNQGGVIYASTTTSYGSSATGTTGQYLKSNAAEAPTWASFVKPVVTWANGTTAGPTLKVQATGGTSDTKAIPIASRSYSGVVTTSEQTFAGTKGFDIIKRNGKNGSAATTWTGDTLLYNGNSVQVGEYWYSFNNNNDATKINTGQFYWRQYSPQSTSGTTLTTDKYETYTLPAVDAGLNDNRNYSILTTKSYVSVAQGGTGASTAAQARTNLGAAAANHNHDDTYLKLSGGEMTGGIILPGGDQAWNNTGIIFNGNSRIGENSNTGALGIYATEKIYLRPNSGTGASAEGVEISTSGLHPSNNNSENLGDSSHKWSNVYATKVTLSQDPANALEAATKQYVDNNISSITNAMVFKGTVGKASGGSGTVNAIPTANVRIGDAYKIVDENKSITATNSTTGAAVTAKIGDTIVATATTPKWTVIPSGDEPSGTVTSIATGVGLTTASGSAITSSGTIKAKLRSETKLTNNSTAATEISNRVYPVAVDKSDYLAVNIPWTDTEQNIILKTTTKGYITAVENTPTTSAAAQAAIADTGVYLTTTAGEINAVQYKINEKSYISYDTAVDAIGFTFV